MDFSFCAIIKEITSVGTCLALSTRLVVMNFRYALLGSITLC